MVLKRAFLLLHLLDYKQHETRQHRLVEIDPPKAAITAVIQVPMLAPKINAAPAAGVIEPVVKSFWTTPITAVDDCMMPVAIVPPRSAHHGFFPNVVMILVNQGSLAKAII